jgi:hypothetical protein
LAQLLFFESIVDLTPDHSWPGYVIAETGGPHPVFRPP